jgi:transcription termination/antitermination protein NusG
MNGSPVDPSDEAVPQPPANADGEDEAAQEAPEEKGPRERIVEAFEEAAEKEAVADAAIEAALEETVEEAIEDAEAVEAASDEAIQKAYEDEVEQAVEAGLEGAPLEEHVVRAKAEADAREAIADDAIEAALEETVQEAVADAAAVEDVSDAAIVGELADEVESIAEDVEREEATETRGGGAESEPASAATARAPAEAQAGQDEEPAEAARDPFGSPGDWYVVHTYAGYENKVKTNLESRIHTMQMEDKIFDVHIPMEDVMEIKGGKKQVVQRKVFPGYLLVKMLYDNDSWYVVRNTPGVTGFVAAGTGSKPTPLSRREVEKILSVKKEEVKPQLRLGFEVDDVVRIISGPFADFNGTISDINPEQGKLRVLVNIFDRETPVELSFDQVAKV